MTLTDEALITIAAAADAGILPLPATVALLCRELLEARRVARRATATVGEIQQTMEASLVRMRMEAGYEQR